MLLKTTVRALGQVCEMTHLSSLLQASRGAAAASGGWSEQAGGTQKHGSDTRQTPHLILAQVSPGGNAAAYTPRDWEGVRLTVTTAEMKIKKDSVKTYHSDCSYRKRKQLLHF